MPNHFIALPLALFVAAFLIWITTLHLRVHTPALAVRRMRIGRLSGLEGYLDHELPDISLARFSAASGGLRGAWGRWQQARAWLGICEYARLHGVADKAALIRMRSHFRAVTLSSLLFVLETILASALPNIMAAHGFNALQMYWKMCQDSYAMFAATDWIVGDTSLEPYF